MCDKIYVSQRNERAKGKKQKVKIVSKLQYGKTYTSSERKECVWCSKRKASSG